MKQLGGASRGPCGPEGHILHPFLQCAATTGSRNILGIHSSAEHVVCVNVICIHYVNGNLTEKTSFSHRIIDSGVARLLIERIYLTASFNQRLKYYLQSKNCVG